jgi:hypothetical protein
MVSDPIGNESSNEYRGVAECQASRKLPPATVCSPNATGVEISAPVDFNWADKLQCYTATGYKI